MPKPTTDNALKISIKSLRTMGALVAGRVNNIEWLTNGVKTAAIQVATHQDRLIFTYTVNGEPVSYTVELERTKCNLGGERLWFRCPCCGRRSSVFYLITSKRFACRSCQGLAYSCQNESGWQRNTRQLSKLRKRLNWYDEGFIFKPRHMQAKTFERLEREAVERYEVATVSLIKMFQSLHKKLSR
jgi:hypothetical protein